VFTKEVTVCYAVVKCIEFVMYVKELFYLYCLLDSQRKESDGKS